MSYWFINEKYPEEIKAIFRSVDAVFSLNCGNKISSHSLSEVFRKEVNGRVFYIKRYFCGGKHLRKYVGRSRCRAEWENLLYFQKLGIKTPEIVAYGEESLWGPFFTGRSILITEEVKNTKDLVAIAEGERQLFDNKAWRDCVMGQVADYLARLHAKRFIHNDLNWRNILATLGDNPTVYFFDIPMGRKYRTSFQRFAAKDLAYLDKMGKTYLSRSDRLKFYLAYKKIKKLAQIDKERILRTFEFFKK